MKRAYTPVEKIERMRNLLSFLLVAAFISAIPLFAFVVIPEKNEQVITYMVGQLSGMALTALGFYFVNKVGQDALDATRSDNTGKMADAIQTALKTGTGAGTDTGNGTEAEPLQMEIVNTEADPANVRDHPVPKGKADVPPDTKPK